MEQEPRLRSVPPTGTGARGGPLARAERGGGAQNRVNALLGTALALALVLLVFCYVALNSQIDSLVGEAQQLRAAVAERDVLISAQHERLDAVRGRVQELLGLLESPVQETPDVPGVAITPDAPSPAPEAASPAPSEP